VVRSNVVEVRVVAAYKLTLKAARFTHWGELLPLEGVRIPVRDAIYFSLIKECYTPCEVVISANVPVRLIAPKKHLGYVFVEWSDGERSNDRVITMNRNIELEARYAPG